MTVHFEEPRELYAAIGGAAAACILICEVIIARDPGAKPVLLGRLRSWLDQMKSNPNAGDAYQAVPSQVLRHLEQLDDASLPPPAWHH